MAYPLRIDRDNLTWKWFAEGVRVGRIPGYAFSSSSIDVSDCEPTVRESAQPPAQQNVQTVSRLEYDALRARSFAERLSDVLTKAIGSLASIAFHVVWFTSTDIAAKSRSPDVAGFLRNGCLSLEPGDTGIHNPRVRLVLSGHLGSRQSASRAFQPDAFSITHEHEPKLR